MAIGVERFEWSRVRLGLALRRCLLAALAISAVTTAAANDSRAASKARSPGGAAGQLIAHFKMQRIPQEGPWFSLTYASDDQLDGAALPTRYGGRNHAAGSAIVVVATGRDFSAMHRLRTDEVWHFYSGSALKLLLLYPDGKGRVVTLGSNVLKGEMPQFAVPHGVWMGAAPVAAAGYSFLGNQLSPGFDYVDFEMGYREELVHQYPAFSKDIGRLTRAEFVKRPAERASKPAAGSLPPAVFSADDVATITAAPGVTLQELVGRLAHGAQTSTVSVAKFTLAPGTRTGASYNHRSQEVFLVTDGTGEVHLGSKTTPVSLDSVAFIPAEQVHSIEADEHSSLTFYAISAPAFSPEDYVPVKP